MTSVLAQALAAGRASLNDQTSERADALPVRYLSVCSGIEAATVAWHALGWTPAAFSEIEAFPRAVLAHRFPAVPLHGDFTTIEGGEYGPVDLLVGGTPCQSFSVAGLRKGLADDRGNLALQFLALARRTGARWVLWENVLGVLSSSGGRDFGAFLGGLAELGYGFAYRVLDAQHFGVPQRRRRVFVVGHLGDWRRAAAVLFERASLQGHPPPRREAGERVARPVDAGSPHGSGYRNDADTADNLIAGTLNANGKAAGSATTQDAEPGLLLAFGGNNQGGPIDIATARSAHGGPHGRLDFETETFITHSLRADGFDAGEDGTGRGTPLVAHAFDARQSDVTQYGCRAGPLDTDGHSQAIAFSSKDHGADAGDLAPTLRAMGHDGSHANAGGQVAVAFHENQRHELTTSDTAGGGKPGQGYPAAMQGSSVRRLTPRECERLQGFPDDWTAVPYRGKPAADGPRYKAIGNSMAVPVMRWIGERIAEVEAFDRVVASSLASPDDAKTRRDRISMSDPAGFPSVDAPSDTCLGGSPVDQGRGGTATVCMFAPDDPNGIPEIQEVRIYTEADAERVAADVVKTQTAT